MPPSPGKRIFSKSTQPLPIALASEDADRAPSEARKFVGQTSAGPENRLRLWVFRLAAAVLIPAILFAAVEFGLRKSGTGYRATFLQPAAEKPGHLADNYKFAWRFFPRALARSSQPILVAEEKPPRTKRIIVFGGSAAMGDPEPAYGFPRMLEVLLELRCPGQDFEVINAAVTAVNSHVVRSIAKDCRRLDADAWVIYMGNNEVHGPYGAGTVFGGENTPLWLIRSGLALKATTTGQLLSGQWGQTNSDSDSKTPEAWGGMAMFLDHQVRHDDPSLERVYRNFEKNLLNILDTGIANGTPVVFSTVVSNLRSSGPFVSLHGNAASTETIQKWQKLFERGCTAQADGRFDEALDLYEQAARLDPEFAELQFRLGECLVQLDKPQPASEHFQRACDFDALRFRACSTINDTIAKVAAQRSGKGVHFIDASHAFSEQSPQGITGEEFLFEHVHFNFAGNYLLAKLFAESLIEALDLEAVAAQTTGWPSQQECAERLGLTLYHQHLILRELRTRLRSPPFDQQINSQVRDSKLNDELSRLATESTPNAARDAINDYRRLLEQHPDDWVLRQQFSTLLESTGDLEGAIEQWREITDQLPHYSEGFFHLGRLFNRAKKYEQAEPALNSALALRPEFARAANSLGIALSHQDRFQESYDAFENAVRIKPEYAEAHYNWGLVLANQGDTRGAVNRYQAALSADPDYVSAHKELGKYYANEKQYDEAENHYSELARVQPNDPNARLNLGLLLLKKNEAARAVRHLQRAVDLDPTSDLARRALARAQQESER